MIYCHFALAALCAVLASIARIALLLVCYHITCFFTLFTIRSTVQIMRNRMILKRLKGTWAIVTGPTDGIGLGISQALADKGVNVVLMGRNPEKLKGVKKDLEARGVQVKNVLVDFCEKIDFDKALSPLKGMDLRVLVNNVGTNNFEPVEFLKNEQSDNILRVNVQNTMRLTKAILKRFQSLPQDRGTRYVLNIGSMLGFLPSPYQQVYAGTKAFLCSWSEALASEFEGRNVHVELLMTGLVCTKLSGAKKPWFFCPSASVYGRNCVSRFGTTRITYPYSPHELLAMATSVFPRWLMASCIKRSQIAMQNAIKRKKDLAAGYAAKKT